MTYGNSIIYALYSIVEDEHPIKVVQYNLYECRNTDTKYKNCWGVVELHNNDSENAFIGDGAIVFYNDLGQDVGLFYFDRALIPEGSSIWVTDRELQNSRESFSIADNKISTARVHFSNLLRKSTDTTTVNSKWKIELINHRVEFHDFPKHTSTIKVINQGNEILFNFKVLISIYDQKNMLVDIGWSEEPGKWQTGINISPSEEKVLEIPSLSISNSCTGPKDLQGYKLVVHTEAISRSGHPLSKTIIFEPNIK